MRRQQSKVKELFRRLIKRDSGEWLEKQPAWIGNLEGAISADHGMIHARLHNGNVIRVMNRVAPERFDMPVIVGRSRTLPTVWQVIEVRDAFDDIVGDGERDYHVVQHEEEGPDRGSWSRKQIKPRTVRIQSASGFIVRVYGDGDLTVNGWKSIPTKDLNLSPYIPSVKAVFVGIESDDNGALSIHVGTEFAAPGIGSPANYPVPAAGKYPIARVLLYAGQGLLLDKHIAVSMPPSFNPLSISSGSHGHALDDLSDVNAPSPADQQVLTYDFYSGEWIAADPTGGGGGSVDWGDIAGTLSDQVDLQAVFDSKLEDAPSDGETYGRKDGAWEVVTGGSSPQLQLVMEPGVTHPPVPVETPDGDDWVYYEV